jgi:hypothetical protein
MSGHKDRACLDPVNWAGVCGPQVALRHSDWPGYRETGSEETQETHDLLQPRVESNPPCSQLLQAFGAREGPGTQERERRGKPCGATPIGVSASDFLPRCSCLLTMDGLISATADYCDAHSFVPFVSNDKLGRLAYLMLPRQTPTLLQILVVS